jgi:hypothetical protein
MRKSSWSLVLGFVLLFTGWAGASGPFEGEVDYQVTTQGGKKVDLVYLIKGKKIRIQTQAEGHEANMIMDLASKKMLMLMPAQKMAMTMDIPNVKKTNASAVGTFKKTGRTDVILGRKVEEWAYKGKKGHGSFWVTSGLGSFMGLGGKPGEGGEAWLEAIKQKKLFPLKMEYQDDSGKTSMTMIATKLEERSLSEDLFKVPSGYKKVDMGHMFDGASGAPKGAKAQPQGDPLEGVKPKLPF